MGEHLKIISQFCESAEAASARITNLYYKQNQLPHVLLKILENEKDVLLSIDDEIYNMFFRELMTKKNFLLNPSDEQLSSINTGITDAFCGIASTGSICISTKNSIANYISILCNNHIVLLKHQSIISDIDQLFLGKIFDNNDLLKSFSIITGSSATADMGPLVRGVHGPGILHIIII